MGDLVCHMLLYLKKNKLCSSTYFTFLVNKSRSLIPSTSWIQCKPVGGFELGILNLTFMEDTHVIVNKIQPVFTKANNTVMKY